MLVGAAPAPDQGMAKLWFRSLGGAELRNDIAAAPAWRRRPGRLPSAEMDDPALSLRPRVLVVEDEPGVAWPFAEALEREGFDPRLARTAREALAAAAESTYDMVI